MKTSGDGRAYQITISPAPMGKVKLEGIWGGVSMSKKQNMGFRLPADFAKEAIDKACLGPCKLHVK